MGELKKKLTPKQKKFIKEYVKNNFNNATDAAIKAGYSKKTAREIAKENLTKPYIKEEIDKKAKKIINLSDDDILTLVDLQKFHTRVVKGEEEEPYIAVWNGVFVRTKKKPSIKNKQESAKELLNILKYCEEKEESKKELDNKDNDGFIEALSGTAQQVWENEEE